MLKNYGNSRGWGYHKHPLNGSPRGWGLKQKCLPFGGGGWYGYFLELHNVKNVSVERILTKYIKIFFYQALPLFVHLRYVVFF